jgi:hypothetical protein
VLKSKAQLKVLKWTLPKYGKIEDIQDQDVDKVFLFILEYRYVVLSRRVLHWQVDQVKVLIS